MSQGEPDISVRVAIACRINISNQSSDLVYYSVNGLRSSPLWPGSSAQPQINNFNLNTITLSIPRRIARNGQNMGVSSSFTASTCDERFVLFDVFTPLPRPLPPPPRPSPPIPLPNPVCSYDPRLLSIGNDIRSMQYSENYLIWLVSGLTAQQINTLICYPDIGNAYLLELAIIHGYPNLVAALLRGGANPNLTSHPQGHSLLRQLFSVGGQNFPGLSYVIQLLREYGGRQF